MLKFASITPHPPIIIPTIGAGADLKLASETIKGMKKLAEKFTEAKVETVLIISPHGQVDSSYFTIDQSPILTGNFRAFGDLETELSFKNDENLIQEIEKNCREKNIPLRLINSGKLDHGTLVPLSFLCKNRPGIKVVPIAYSYLDLESHFKFGQVLYSAINNSLYAIGIIASGDLSHRLTPDAPAGYSLKGAEFDEKLIDMIKNKNSKGILNMDQNLVGEAGECGYRSIITLLGALDGLNYEPEILSYEGPFGVGYLVANFKF